MGLYINFGKLYNQSVVFYIPNLRLITLLENALIDLNIKYTREQSGRIYIIEDIPSIYAYFYNNKCNKEIVLPNYVWSLSQIQCCKLFNIILDCEVGDNDNSLVYYIRK